MVAWYARVCNGRVYNGEYAMVCIIAAVKYPNSKRSAIKYLYQLN